MAEVEEHLTRRQLPDSYRTEFTDPANRRRHRRNERGGRRFEQRDRIPVAGSIGRGAPSRMLAACIICFAAVDIGANDWAGSDPPASIGRHALRPAVLIANLELQAQGQSSAIEIPLTVESEIAPVPAVAEHRSDDVLTGSQQPGDVVGLILEPAMVRRPPRSKQLITDALAVEMELVEAEARDIETSRGDCTPDAKCPTQQRRRRWQAICCARRWADPVGGPIIGPEQRRFPIRDGAPR